MTNTISFPNIDLSFEITETFKIPFIGHEVAWYGVIVTLGIISAVLYVFFRSRQHGIITDDFLDVAIYTVVFGVVGARLYYVLTSLELYESFWDVFKVWEGGLAIYGGIICGALAAIVVLKIKKINVIKFFDGLGPAVMLGQIIGRWGNFVNGEAYGYTDKFEFFGLNFNIASYTDKLPWLMNVNGVLCQPTFLYECVWNIIGFVIINIFYPKKKYDGQILLCYLGWYGFGRTFIEGLREDSLRIGSIRISQLLGCICFLVCLVLLLIFAFKKTKSDSPLYNKSLSIETEK